MSDLTASLKLSRRGATLILGLRARCSRTYAMLWRPLLIEGLIGSGQAEQATAVLDRLRAENGEIGYLQPALAWLEGWLAEQRGDPEEALGIYQRGENTASAGSPVYTARLLLAHGRLLRRTGNRKDAVGRLRRPNNVYLGLRAAPFIARTAEDRDHGPGLSVAGGAYGFLDQLFPPIWLLPWAR